MMKLTHIATKCLTNTRTIIAAISILSQQPFNMDLKKDIEVEAQLFIPQQEKTRIVKYILLEATTEIGTETFYKEFYTQEVEKPSKIYKILLSNYYSVCDRNSHMQIVRNISTLAKLYSKSTIPNIKKFLDSTDKIYIILDTQNPLQHTHQHHYSPKKKEKKSRKTTKIEYVYIIDSNQFSVRTDSFNGETLYQFYLTSDLQATFNNATQTKIYHYCGLHSYKKIKNIQSISVRQNRGLNQISTTLIRSKGVSYYGETNDIDLSFYTLDKLSFILESEKLVINNKPIVAFNAIIIKDLTFSDYIIKVKDGRCWTVTSFCSGYGTVLSWAFVILSILIAQPWLGNAFKFLNPYSFSTNQNDQILSTIKQIKEKTDDLVNMQDQTQAIGNVQNQLIELSAIVLTHTQQSANSFSCSTIQELNTHMSSQISTFCTNLLANAIPTISLILVGICTCILGL